MFCLHFQRLTASIYGANFSCFIHRIYLFSNHRTTFHITQKYLREVKNPWKLQPSFKQHADKTNVHHALNLTVKPVPLYEKGLFVYEIGFEVSCQPLKYALSRSTIPNAHIYAVQHILARDWLTRILHAYNSVRTREAEEREGEFGDIFWEFLIGSLLKELTWTFISRPRIELRLKALYGRCLMNKSRIYFSVDMDALKLTGKVLNFCTGVRCSNQNAVKQKNEVDHNDI